jgi:hypothetical protein
MIVPGAAVWGNEVSPVFRERINHAMTYENVVNGLTARDACRLLNVVFRS